MHRILCFCLFLLGTCGAQASLPPLADNEAYKPLLIEGEDLPMALGLPLDQLSLAAVVDDVMEPVPYQIDQYNAGGAPYFPDWEIPFAGTPGQFNATDKLLFIYKDAGVRRTADMPVDGTVLAEISLRDRSGQPRYVYLMHQARLRSEEQYVRYSPDLGLVETDFYSLRYQDSNHLRWDDLQFASYVGDRPIDNMKLKVSGGVMMPQLRMDLTNENMVAKPAGAIIGPIRTTTQADFNVYFAGVHVVRFSLQIHHYPKSVMYDLRGVMPTMLRQFAANPTVSMEVDANGWVGAEVRSATAAASQVSVVDGKVDAAEMAMQKTPLSRDQNWIWINSKRNLDVLSFMDYVGNFDEPLSLLLEDDLNVKEDVDLFAGRLPSIGYRIENLPDGGPLGMVASIYFSDSFAGDPAQIAQQLRTQPDLQVIPYH